MTAQSIPQGGLFHSEADLRLARDNLDGEPISGALARLQKPEADPLAQAHLYALRGQLFEELEAGYRAAAALNAIDFLAADPPDLQGIKRALGWLSVAAMLRDHPAWQAAWREPIASTLDHAGPADEGLPQFWLAALKLAAGLLLESDEAIESGAAMYRRAVEQRIHPEGFFRGIADIADGKDLYEAQVSATCALALMAEMAGQVGRDLWSYESRAVSIFTAVAYTHFYYFFPEKWRWEADLVPARTDAIMRRDGAFMELVNRRRPPNGIEQFLSEQRPLFCAWGGGLTTLTHGLAPARQRRWRLW